MEKDIWIKRYGKLVLQVPVAVVGSPGLRSIGKLVVESLIAETKAELAAELYSTHLPSIYETQPSYAAHPALPGFGGVLVESGSVDLPKVQFYVCQTPPMVIVKGYHANFEGQYSVAEEVVAFLSELHVKRVVVVAGYGSKEKKVCCAATSFEIIQEMKQKFNVDIGYKGPFMGFSGLVFGLAKLQGMEALCLFAGTEPKEENLEFPDKESAERAILQLRQIIENGGSANEQPNPTV
jgi:proteasome assembly chaperone (PAC2) family protein